MSNLYYSIASLVEFILSLMAFIYFLTYTGWSFMTIFTIVLMAVTLVSSYLFLGMYFMYLMNVKYK